MRDPNRIPSFMRELENVWREFPDMRFGQLVMNLTRDGDGAFQDCWEWDVGAFRQGFQRNVPLWRPEGQA